VTTALPEPHFIDRDPLKILRECIEAFELSAGRALQPSQVERLIIDLIAYRETLIRIGIQEAAKQNLRAYARFPMIDFLAEMVGASRLAAQPAKSTQQQFTLAAAEATNRIIPKSTRVRTKDGRVTFATDVDATILAGATTIVGGVAATAEEAGPIGNHYAPGQVSELVSTFDVPITSANLTETSDGTAAESTERLSARLPDAIATYAAAGPEDAYRIHALSASPDVLDVYVESTVPGVVKVHVLATYGIPSGALLTIVETALSAKKVRPICDTVLVVAAVIYEYALNVQLTLKKGSPTVTTLAAATEAADEYAAERSARLGRSLVPSQVIGQLSRPKVAEDGSITHPELARVHKVNVITPVEHELAPNEWASCTGVTVTVVGFANEDE
jgi:phage-related baseplate assembly protein